MFVKPWQHCRWRSGRAHEGSSVSCHGNAQKLGTCYVLRLGIESIFTFIIVACSFEAIFSVSLDLSVGNLSSRFSANPNEMSVYNLTARLLP